MSTLTLIRTEQRDMQVIPRGWHLRLWDCFPSRFWGATKSPSSATMSAGIDINCHYTGYRRERDPGEPAGFVSIDHLSLLGTAAARAIQWDLDQKMAAYGEETKIIKIM